MALLRRLEVFGLLSHWHREHAGLARARADAIE